MRGTSPQSFTILSLTSDGFSECRPIGDMTTLCTPAFMRFGLPFVARRHISTLLLVQFPSPQKRPPLFLFSFTHAKAMVLYTNPHASIKASASLIVGKVAHKNSTQSSAVIPPRPHFAFLKVLHGSLWGSDRMPPRVLQCFCMPTEDRHK